MLITLPPKRFQQIDNPKYDPVRHKPWFAKLEKRRAKLGMLELAYLSWKKEGKTQIASAIEYGVDGRELRDYAAYVEKTHDPITRNMQACLDDAYSHYAFSHGERSFRFYVESMARLYGMNPRHVVEAWEVNPNFYPTNYTPFCDRCGTSDAMIKHKDGKWYCHKTHSL